jgi:hypothetical protein
MRNWMRLPSRIALMLGFGALSIAGVRADAAVTARPGDDTTVLPQQSAKTFSDLLIWRDAGRIYVSESGKPAEELRLGSTAEAALLGQLLEKQGATAANPYPMRDRIILVGGGGSGFAWDSNRQHDSGKPGAGNGNPKQ